MPLRFRPGRVALVVAFALCAWPTAGIAQAASEQAGSRATPSDRSSDYGYSPTGRKIG